MASSSIRADSPVGASLFPLESIDDVVNYFQHVLEHSDEPDLTQLNIITGYIEHTYTTNYVAQMSELTAAITDDKSSDSNKGIRLQKIPFPVVTREEVDTWRLKFKNRLSKVQTPDGDLHNRPAATREVIKQVSDVFMKSLIWRNKKDSALLLNIFSFLCDNKLDSIGVALAVVAGCQLLGYRDVHLAITEDHAWVVFGENQLESVEVTWRGHNNDDQRGHDVSNGVKSGLWIYSGGHPVVCDRHMEVAVIVSRMEISCGSYFDCPEVMELQQKLLWLLYDKGHLKKYPLGLGTLAELEEENPMRDSINCEQLYREAVKSAHEHYENHHVYPYTYQGNYYNRVQKYREAFAAWANAANVLGLYTYGCRDDEEIYKEMRFISDTMILIIRNDDQSDSADGLVKDSEVFANLLRFYDGICRWEENCFTQVLHNNWAKLLLNAIRKFDVLIRSQVVMEIPEEMALNTMNDDTVQQLEENNNLVEMEEEHTFFNDLMAAVGAVSKKPYLLLCRGAESFSYQKQKFKNHVDDGIENAITTPLPEPILNAASRIEEVPFDRPVIQFYSQKMKGMKNLLVAPIINVQAITLQLTGNLVDVRKSRGSDASSGKRASLFDGANNSASRIRSKRMSCI